MRRQRSGEEGFTLIEIMLSVVILSIVGLTMTGFFAQSLANAKGNQSKTVMVNLARNALFYIEKQSFDKLAGYFDLRDEAEHHPSLTSELCRPAACSVYSALVDHPEVLAAVLNPTVNGITYQIMIEYQDGLHKQMRDSADRKAIAPYLIPVKVTVKNAAEPDNKRGWTEVEGYITDEAIR
ncbi:PulJ/GspJ family protein [Paenibacillus tarimensis]|uniref:PulJ/GspJ family protein n=1 Tax=Paenibacillus tarimensis TaxID=416012 RepID=UPI001F3CEAE2|nr:type II secretion system protein [Paenibacillus tarimensis]MCF2943416.1 type II secretion system GspH family protein [Paenibacillus tarimensis]